METIEEIQENIAQPYREERGALMHSCEGTSGVQRFQLEEAIMLLDLEYYAAMTAAGLDCDCPCDNYRHTDNAFYLVFEGVDGSGNISYFSDPRNLLAAIKECDRGGLGWSVIDEESLESDTYSSDEQRDGDEEFRRQFQEE